MAKTKTASLSKKLNLSKNQLIVICGLLALAGIYFVWKTQAASYRYNTKIWSSSLGTIYACKTSSRINLKVNTKNAKQLATWFNDGDAFIITKVASNTTYYKYRTIQGKSFNGQLVAYGFGDGPRPIGKAVSSINAC